jgi:hypothetical protein
VFHWLSRRRARPVTDIRAAARPGLRIERLVVILHIHHGRQTNLLGIRKTTDGACLLAGLREDREEDGRQNSDDGDHNEQFDQSETGTLVHYFPPDGLMRE